MQFSKFLLLLIPVVSAVVIHCDFKLESWNVIGDVYKCGLKSNPSIFSRDVTVTGSTGYHVSWKDHTDVSSFYSGSLSDVINYMPRGLSKVFPNLIAIYIDYGRVKEIHQNDLKEFYELKYLDIQNSDITYLKADLFRFNTKLQYIRFEYGKINQVHATAFRNLNQLQWLDMNSNTCISEVAKSKSAVSALIHKVHRQCLSHDSALGDSKEQQIYENESSIMKEITNLKLQYDEKLSKIDKFKASFNDDIHDLKIETNNKLKELTTKLNMLLNKNIYSDNFNQDLS